MLGSRKKKTTSHPDDRKEDHVQTITVKNLEGNKNKNKEDNTAADSNFLIEEINRIAFNLLEAEKENYDDFDAIYMYSKDHAKESFFIELMTNPFEIISALGKITDNRFRDTLSLYLDMLFSEIAENCPDLKNNDHNFFTNFKHLLSVMLRGLVHLSPNAGAYSSYLRMMHDFGQAMAQDKNSCSILFLESIGLEYLIEFAKKYTNKKDALVHIMMAICPQGDDMHLRLLKRIEKMVGSDYRTLSGLLAHMSIYQAADGFEGEIFDFYWVKAIYLLEFPCPKIRTNGLKILNELSRFDYTKMPACYPHLRMQCNEVWWETKAQILIICANQLEVIEMAHQEETSKYVRSNVEKRISRICRIPKNMAKRPSKAPFLRSIQKTSHSIWSRQTRIQDQTPTGRRSTSSRRPTTAKATWH